MESQSIYANTACNWWYRAGSASFIPAIGGHPPPFFFLPSDGSDATVCGGRQDERYIVIFLAGEAA